MSIIRRAYNAVRRWRISSAHVSAKRRISDLFAEGHIDYDAFKSEMTRAKSAFDSALEEIE